MSNPTVSKLLTRSDATLGQQPLVSTSHFFLAKSFFLAGDLKTAEEHALAALSILESHKAPGARWVLELLAEIAAARGDIAAAADYSRRRDTAYSRDYERAFGRLPAEVDLNGEVRRNE